MRSWALTGVLSVKTNECGSLYSDIFSVDPSQAEV